MVPQDHAWTSYNTSKSAVLQMARSMACELGPKNIRVNTISPGYIRTRCCNIPLRLPLHCIDALQESGHEAGDSFHRQIGCFQALYKHSKHVELEGILEIKKVGLYLEVMI